MFFSLDVLRARKGDCLMLHYGSEEDPHLILIDGGPAKVYKPHLKPRIVDVLASRGLDEGDALPVDVVMVSHVDDDHIRGIVELTEEQRLESPDVRLDVDTLWHNSFDDLLTTKPEELMAGFGPASVLAGVNTEAAFAGIEAKDKDQHQAIEVLAGIAQGRTLRDNAKELDWKPNRQFKGKLILATDASKPVTLDELKVTVVGPMQPELLELQKAHDEFLREMKKAGKKITAETVLAAFIDESIANLSSIVVLAELGGKSMLLTGDARGDKIMEGLELVGRLKAGDKMHIDLLKVPHHGSENNMEPIFFERLPADHYVFSGNGQHGNPERETLEMLLEGRGEEPDYTIHLTYPIDEIDVERKKAKKDWSPAKHSLKAFFAAHPKMLKKVKVVDESKPHMIDLLDRLKL